MISLHNVVVHRSVGTPIKNISSSLHRLSAGFAAPCDAAPLAFFFFLQCSNQIRYHTYVTKNDQKG